MYKVSTMPKDRFRFTSDVLTRARILKETRNWTWDQVAEELGCSSASLSARLTEQRKGRIKWAADRSKKECAEIERAAIVEGKSGAQIARERGISGSAVNTRLRKMGLDAEMRAEFRNVPKE